MRIKIHYQNELEQKLVGYQKLFRQISLVVFAHERMGGSYELSLSIVSEEKIREFNRTYRAIDEVTDVLSFAQLEGVNYTLPKDMPLPLGDILICYDQAEKQASAYGHSIRREMAFLFTHGLLHLLGYDHMNEKDEKKMFALQERILNKLGIRR